MLVFCDIWEILRVPSDFEFTRGVNFDSGWFDGLPLSGLAGIRGRNSDSSPFSCLPLVSCGGIWKQPKVIFSILKPSSLASIATQPRSKGKQI